MKSKKPYFPNFNRRRKTPQPGRDTTAILRAVEALTPSSCPECSSAEVAAHLQNTITSSDVHSIGSTLAKFKQAGLVANRRMGTLSLWKLTEAGKQFLRKAA